MPVSCLESRRWWNGVLAEKISFGAFRNAVFEADPLSILVTHDDADSEMPSTHSSGNG